MLRVIYPSRFVGWTVSVAIMILVLVWGGVELLFIASENEISAKTLFYSSTLIGKIDSRTVDYAGEVYHLRYPRSWKASTENGRTRFTNENSDAFIEIILHTPVNVSLEEFFLGDERNILSQFPTSINGFRALKVSSSDGERYLIVAYVSIPQERVLEVALSYARNSADAEGIESTFDTLVDSLVITP